MQRTVATVHARGGVTLPVIALSADRPGPTVVVTGNLHGDELTGLLAVHELDRLLEAELVCGAVRLYPSLNPGGLRAQTRTVPEDGMDLNRVFPGDERGGAASRLAATLWADILAHRPDVVLDLHADAAVSVPYAIVDRPVFLRGAAVRVMETALTELASATGVTTLVEYRAAEYLRYGLDRSLAGAMVNIAQVPALTLEIGPRRAVSPTATSAAVDAVCGVLAARGMVERSPPPHATRVEGGPWRRSPAPRVHVSGVFAAVVPPGAAFEPGQVIGTVCSVDGTVLERVVAPSRGIVVSWADVTWVEPRSVVGTLGLEDV